MNTTLIGEFSLGLDNQTCLFGWRFDCSMQGCDLISTTLTLICRCLGSQWWLSLEFGHLGQYKRLANRRVCLAKRKSESKRAGVGRDLKHLKAWRCKSFESRPFFCVGTSLACKVGVGWTMVPARSNASLVKIPRIWKAKYSFTGISISRTWASWSNSQAAYELDKLARGLSVGQSNNGTMEFLSMPMLDAFSR